MDAGPEVNPPAAGTAREALEDLVYRSTLGEGALPGASPWLTVPVTLAVAGLLAAVALALGPRAGAGANPVRTVDVVLQEAPEAPARAAPAPAPAPARAAAPPALAPAPAPAPAPLIREAPPPASTAVPEETPRELPREDQSRQYGGQTGAGGAPGAIGGGGAGAGGVGAGGTGAALGRTVDLAFTSMRVKFKPPKPDYPPLAKQARIQGTVVVLVTVGTDGVPATARALEGPFQLRAAAEAHALAWRFFPPTENGVPLASRFTLTMPFTLY